MCYGTIAISLYFLYIIILFVLNFPIKSIFINLYHFTIVICFFSKIIFWSITQSSSMFRTNKGMGQLAIWFVTDFGLLFVCHCLLVDGLLFLDARFACLCRLLVDLNIDDLIHYWSRNAFITFEAWMCLVFAYYARILLAFLYYLNMTALAMSKHMAFYDFRIVKIRAEYWLCLIEWLELNGSAFQSLYLLLFLYFIQYLYGFLLGSEHQMVHGQGFVVLPLKQLFFRSKFLIKKLLFGSGSSSFEEGRCLMYQVLIFVVLAVLGNVCLIFECS